MRRFSRGFGLKNESRRAKRHRLQRENIMTTENLKNSIALTQPNNPQFPGFSAKNQAEAPRERSDVDLFEEKAVNAGAKNVGDQGEGAVDECSGRERLQRHRMQIAGNVWIPETWEQEDRLKEWIDPKVLDQALAPNGLMSARIALVEDCRPGDHPKSVTIDMKAV